MLWFFKLLKFYILKFLEFSRVFLELFWRISGAFLSFSRVFEAITIHLLQTHSDFEIGLLIRQIVFLKLKFGNIFA